MSNLIHPEGTRCGQIYAEGAACRQYQETAGDIDPRKWGIALVGRTNLLMAWWIR